MANQQGVYPLPFDTRCRALQEEYHRYKAKHPEVMALLNETAQLVQSTNTIIANKDGDQVQEYKTATNLNVLNKYPPEKRRRILEMEISVIMDYYFLALSVVRKQLDAVHQSLLRSDLLQGEEANAASVRRVAELNKELSRLWCLMNRHSPSHVCNMG